MKKLFCIGILLVLACAVVPVSSLAQNNLSYSLETAAGAGFGKGPLFTLCPQFVFQDKFDSGIVLGMGAGMRFAMPCVQYNTNNGVGSRDCGMELDLPLFLRIGYGKNHFFSNVDAGYAIGVIATTNLGAVSGGRTKLSYNGLFCEPQVGWKLNERHALALGVLFQNSTYKDCVVTQVDDMVSKEVTTRNQFTPAITFRYIFFFGRKK